MLTPLERVNNLLADLRYAHVDFDALFAEKNSLTPLESVELFLAEQQRLRVLKQNLCPAAGETAACGDENAFPAVYRLPAPRRTLSGIPSADGGRIRPEIRLVPRGSRLLPAWDRASARMESLAFDALYDLQNGIYTDIIVQKEHEKNEKAALCAMVDRSAVSAPVILLADRGYEACNNLARLERKGWKYLIRLRDKNRAVAYGLKLPGTAQFDIPAHITLGWLTARQLERQGLVVPASYYRVPPQMTFDGLEPKSTGFVDLSFRIVRIETENNDTELLITNLCQRQFEIVRKRRRNFVVFRRAGGARIRC